MIKIKKFDNELDELIELMTSNTWEFHGNPHPTREEIVSNVRKGWYLDGKETFWIEYLNEKVGLMILLDIADSIPLFDIRLDKKYRGKGIGTEAIKWLIDYVFSLPDRKIRLEAYTRSDNLAMHKTLRKCGFLKEGYLRKSWENKDGSIHDTVIFGFIRDDWRKNGPREN